MAASQPSVSQVERWISFGGTILAPATALSALLFYFGYVSARSQYAYFGIDVDTVGLSTQDYVMRSPQPLLVPLLVLALIGAGLLLLHAAARRRIESAVTSRVDDESSAANPSGQIEQIRRIAKLAIGAGIALLGAGIFLLFSYTYVRGWPLYNLITPLLMATGSALLGYASRILNILNRSIRQAAQAGAGSNDPAPNPGTDPATNPDPVRRETDVIVILRRTAGALICVVIAASTFWATATIAQWSGRGVARYDAGRLSRLPNVILDTKERLFLRSPGIEETILPASAGQTFHYRYRNLRLLIEGHDRMFLVPEQWSASNSTLIVALDNSVRIQFQFQNDPP